ncbi:MAG: sterol desaturase family protein [Pseudomonadota bacterium]
MPYAQESASFLFIALICAFIEYAWRRRKGLGYDLGSLGGHLGIMVGVAISRGLTGVLMAGVLFASYSLAPVNWDLADWKTWVVGFFVLDFFYYWQHRFGHEVRWGWAAHSVHHSTNEFTLPASFRLSWLSFFSLSWLVYIPMTLAGFSPVLITVLLAVNLRFQYFLHTEAIGKLGALEWIFNTPSHHRVHHGSNPEYLDKNYGGVLIVFDRLFGTFAEERDENPVVYGLTKRLESNNPFVIVFQEWINMARASLRARTPRQLLRVLFGRPSDDQPTSSKALNSESSNPAAAKPASG